ncbi:hypothetical protein F4553_001470 [Allocatelliglobosispora scoriae]|uniref:Ig-like domain-containing protein n=1 Tax=Allocatelliglobosispora scoriae TaxID=643052 RepID=A0A841BML6_9ACTN|nr:hypothetical protein [Allocatelliglobosispora scoriae]MBB5868091.1 hypothetical protein [Allocatelliglobosispora scoriae]
MSSMLKALLALTLTVAIVPVVAAPAHASPLDLTCAVGTETESYHPGLRLFSQTVTVTVQRILSSCVSVSHPAVTSAVITVSVSAEKSCLDALPEPSTGSFPITWNTAQSSVFTFNRTVAIVGGATVITRTGTITSGLFSGATAVNTTILPVTNPLDCLFEPGLTAASGTSALVLS